MTDQELVLDLRAEAKRVRNVVGDMLPVDAILREERAADRIEAQAAEITALRAAVRDALISLDNYAHGCDEWRLRHAAVIARALAAKENEGG